MCSGSGTPETLRLGGCVVVQVVRTVGEMARKQALGLKPNGTFGAVARYLPGLSGMRLL